MIGSIGMAIEPASIAPRTHTPKKPRGLSQSNRASFQWSRCNQSFRIICYSRELSRRDTKLSYRAFLAREHARQPIPFRMHGLVQRVLCRLTIEPAHEE